MGISGYEVMVMCTISPFLLTIASFRSLIVRNVSLVHLLSLAGILAYLFKVPEYRLFAVGFGVSMSCLAWSATWYAERTQPARLDARILAWSIGLIMSSTAKFAFYTNNPIWPIVHAENGGWNKVGLALAIAAILRSNRGTLKSKYGLESFDTSQSSLLAALGLGGIFFALHSLLSDSSTMILWVWDGFPVKGPIAANGVFIILAMGFGIFVGITLQDKMTILMSLVAISIGSYLVTWKNNWQGFTGALILASNLLSVTPLLIKSAVRHGPATFGTGFLIYNVLVLAHVWVVAYAFVPGGPLMREHTDWVMIKIGRAHV